MSRCFPFPPQGYVKKARIDDPDLLAKEKHNEKKHKKKDKEKIEGKEKKDKDRHKDKHREKKDCKEKHKERERERDKVKNRSLDAKGIELQTGFCNGEKLDPNSVHSNEIKDSKHLQELARRLRDQDGASGSRIVPNVTASDDRTAKVLGMASESNVVGKLKKFNITDKKEDNCKENGQRNHVVARSMEKLSVQISSSMEQERGEPITKPLGKKEADKQTERKEKKRHKEKMGKGDKEKHKDRDRGKDKDSKDKDRDKNKKAEEKVKETRDSSKESAKWKESNHKLVQSTMETIDFRNINPSDSPKLGNASLTGDGNPSKRKECEKNGYIIDDGNRPNKSVKLSFHQPVIENGRKLEPSQTLIQFEQNGASLKNHGVEIKESKSNGFITPQRPCESLAKPLPTGLMRNENSEASAKGKLPHPGAKYSTDMIRNENGVASAKVKPPHPDVKYPTGVTRNENGEASAKVKPSHPVVKNLTDVTRNENGEASAKVKLPHPDAKYLSQILVIPTMEDLHDSLDEEWLFGGNHLPLKKLNTVSSAVDCMQQVWSEAVQIESADISALPYVLPY